MKLLVTGAQGQLGLELVKQASVLPGVELLAVGRASLDITDVDAVNAVIAGFTPDAVINAAAYTAVDKAESELKLAYAINAAGPKNLAAACANQGARLIHISTDFVFDGQAYAPYQPNAATNPLSVYGQTKLDGERAVIDALPHAYTIVRTAWVYGAGGQNFVTTMLRLLAQREELSVVMDQIGCPTSTPGLAAGLLELVTAGMGMRAILHHSDAGVASWYDFACAIRELARARQPGQVWARVKPIYAIDYPTPAKRPQFSLLDSRGDFGLPGLKTHWRDALADALPDILATVPRST